ncbi:specifically androgen-regulated gene protein [Latimeria chalumnae]|uniref:Specifically androgen-regulated gene protein n=1 Tax=Latimeria chalumnae TaxID=7897 RepID=M3XJ41_LATCH|nr:PREDICTED: specifically androgen-regulated gene protein [Latimeria chalumnae]|eukprot:XP_005987741.1 PREDICTED: specifically androgen-regulated gene protein [Latimeria chalumnae]
MPESDSWPGDTMDFMTRVSSAGSCDSMTSNKSNNSASSDDSYNHLSAEERACLLFLEETIVSLETEAGSGLSTDESERMDKLSPRRNITKTELLADSLVETTRDGSHPAPSELCKKKNGGKLSALLVPTPLVLTAGSNKLQSGQKSDYKITKSTSMAMDSSDNSSECNVDVVDGLSSLQIVTDKGRPQSPPSFKQSARHAQKSVSLTALISPPEPFRDQNEKLHKLSEIQLPLQTSVEKPDNRSKQNDITQKQPKRLENVEGSIAQNQTPHGGNEFSGWSSSKRAASHSHQLELSREQPVNPPAVPPLHEPLLEKKVWHSSLSAPAVETLETKIKQGPPTAPKPRKLPSNIIIKTSHDPLFVASHGSGKVVSREVSSNDSSQAESSNPPSGKNQVLLKPDEMEQQKARLEALKKLGLLKDEPNGSHAGPVHLPKSSRLREAPATKQAVSSDLERKSLQSSDQLERPRIGNVRSHTLERSGVGLSSDLAKKKQAGASKESSITNKQGSTNMSSKVLRNTRPRPVSLGTGKDFKNIENQTDVQVLEKNIIRRSFPSQSFTQRMPRPPGISVKITPKGSTNEDRQEALKILGLLKE